MMREGNVVQFLELKYYSIKNDPPLIQLSKVFPESTGMKPYKALNLAKVISNQFQHNEIAFTATVSGLLSQLLHEIIFAGS